jgi:hypothetical protein
MRLVSGFLTFFDVLLRPFVPTVFALVRVLEFLHVNDYWSAALSD